MGKLQATSIALIIAFTTSSCTSTISGIGKVIDEVIAATKAGCDFVPAVETVIKIVASLGGPNAAPIVEVANKICGVVKTKDGGLKSLPPGGIYGYVNGVAVRSAPPQERP